jgi:hypothetical protein
LEFNVVIVLIIHVEYESFSVCFLVDVVISDVNIS